MLSEWIFVEGEIYYLRRDDYFLLTDPVLILFLKLAVLIAGDSLCGKIFASSE